MRQERDGEWGNKKGMEREREREKEREGDSKTYWERGIARHIERVKRKRGRKKDREKKRKWQKEEEGDLDV